MRLSVSIYKERKEKDFRMVILPKGKNKIGLNQIKNYGIVSYLNKEEKEKIGEIVLWALSQSDEEVIENKSEIKIEKMYSNESSYSKFTRKYNVVDFDFEKDGTYILSLGMKDGRGYSEFRDKDGNMYEIKFEERPSALELGTKLMEMFEFKEKYDGDY